MAGLEQPVHGYGKIASTIRPLAVANPLALCPAFCRVRAEGESGGCGGRRQVLHSAPLAVKPGL